MLSVSDTTDIGCPYKLTLVKAQASSCISIRKRYRLNRFQPTSERERERERVVAEWISRILGSDI